MILNKVYASQVKDFEGLVNSFIDIINFSLFPLLLAIIVIYFTWKMIDTFVINASNEQARSSGKRVIAITLIVMVVMMSIWGIVNILSSSIFG